MTKRFGSRRSAIVAQTLSELAAAPRLADLERVPHLEVSWRRRAREVVVRTSDRLTIRLGSVGTGEHLGEEDAWRSWTAGVLRDVSFGEA